MAVGYILDAGVLQGLAKERAPNTPLGDRLHSERQAGRRLVTIREVMAECLDVPYSLLDALGILVEPTASLAECSELLDRFGQKADKHVVAHAIARRLDILTTDGAMKTRSYREMLRDLERMPDDRLPGWFLSFPYIEIVGRGLWH